ncbi:MAG: bifunctional heptose 7-phosphate kinase/heptose 1-phosphate adenyltransferase [Pyrinomonadaceae bacterium]
MTLGNEIRSKFIGKRIAVVGDIVADQFLSGTISRVSREAPVFILRHDETETRPGGAANAAANIASLGGEPRLVGLIGRDSNGDSLLKAFTETNVVDRFVIRSDFVSTTAKVRVLGGQSHSAKKQVIRIDYENKNALSPDDQNSLIKNLVEASHDADAIVFSDYNYGVCNSTVFEAAKKISAKQKIPVIVDSRFRLEEFRGASSATPNQEETEKMLGRLFLAGDAESLRERLGFDSLLVTLGGQGMVLARSGEPIVSIPAVGSDQPVDVTGAGDTVIAAFSLGSASGLSPSDAARVANHAGGIVVMKRGTSVATLDELAESLDQFRNNAVSASSE